MHLFLLVRSEQKEAREVEKWKEEIVVLHFQEK